MNERHHSESSDVEQSHNRNAGSRSALIDRRAYLKATGALTGIGAVGAGQAAANRTDKGADDDSDGPEAADLSVEYQTTPNNVSVPANTEESAEIPRFLWEIVGPRGVTQSAYRILVASKPELLQREEGDIWDSGKVSSSQSTQVPYAGSPLEPDTTYHWNVKIWTDAGEQSEWSDLAQFATAVPDTEKHWEG